MDIIRALFGIAVLLGLMVLLSASRKSINWRIILSGLGLQFALGLLILKVPAAKGFFSYVSQFFVLLLDFTRQGSQFLFGDFAKEGFFNFGFLFAFQVLPTIIFVAALTSLLYYLGVLQRIVFVFAWIMKRVMKLSGAESMAAAANVFVGQTEAPLLVKPYIDKMTRSELMALMVGGMATIAGSVMAAYIGLLGGGDPAETKRYATLLLCASLMNAPAALYIAKILQPETQEFDKRIIISKDKAGGSILESIANGTTEGLKLALNVAAMLLVFIALMAMANHFLGNFLGEHIKFGEGLSLNNLMGNWSGGTFDKFTMEGICGFIFAPIAWLLGIPNQDLLSIGSLLGQKFVLNEFIAYTGLQGMIANGTLTPKSITIATFALCGFANFSSIGIQLGGIGTLAPGRRPELAALALKSMIGGTVASLISGTIAGILLS